MGEETIADARGRVLSLRKIGVLEQARMLRAIGAAQSQNIPYVQMVECAMMVSAIDGVPVPLPANEGQIDALMGRLGDEGMAAVMVRRVKDIQGVMAAAEAAAEAEAGTPADPLAPSAAS